MAKLTAAKRKKLPSKAAGMFQSAKKKTKADNKLRTVGKHALPPTGRY